MGSDPKIHHPTGNAPTAVPRPAVPRPAVPRPSPRPLRARPPAKPVRKQPVADAVPMELEAAVFVPDAQQSPSEAEAAQPFFPPPEAAAQPFFPPSEAAPKPASSRPPAVSTKPRSGPPPLPRQFPLRDLVLRDASPLPRKSPPPLPRSGPPPLPRKSPPPAAFAYAQTPVEHTSPPTTVEVELEVEPPKPRRRFRAGVALTVLAVAIAGAGLSLHTVSTRGVALVVNLLAPSAPGASPSRTVAAPAAVVEVPAASAGGVQSSREAVPPPLPIAPPTESAEVPVSSVTAPSCQQALGTEFVEKLDPVGAAAETQAGQRALVRGDMAAAHAAFCKAALWDGGTIERQLNLANLYLLRRDGKQALAAAARVLELDAKNDRALEIQADAWAHLGKLAKARRAYLAAEERPGSEEDAQKWLVRRELDAAQRSLAARDYARAERFFLRVIAFEPQHELATFGVALCLRKLDDSAGADAWSRRAKELANHPGKKPQH